MDSTRQELRLPAITDRDEAWVCKVLGLRLTASNDANGAGRRQRILRTLDSLDVEACPGSGKTTLVVAKLAILARKWTDPSRGICVLSHTNVARLEIEQKLGNTPEGQLLLSYPHFIGTIHGFAGQFLAIPWLRSLGYPVRVIDDLLCEEHRRHLLELKKFSALRTYVRNHERDARANVVGKWLVSSPQFQVQKAGGKPQFKSDTGPAAKQLRLLAEFCVKDGYYRYDEMFMWGSHLLECQPDAREAIRDRFPLLLIDEVQDNSETQANFLFRVFMSGEGPVIRQRYGDTNQAIFEDDDAVDGTISDRFPDKTRCDIYDSHRFGKEIGRLADPLAIHPQGMLGRGPSRHLVSTNTTERHTIFLFSEQTVTFVLPSYARYLRDLFSPRELRNGVFAAVGGVHRPGDGKRLPRSVTDYWPQYDHRLTTTAPRPGTFCEYLVAGHHLAFETGATHHLVERFAEAILRLGRLANPQADFANRRRRHRYVLELLEGEPDLQRLYLRLITRLAEERRLPSKEAWPTWARALARIAQAICGQIVTPDSCGSYLDWKPDEAVMADQSITASTGNLFCYPFGDPEVEIMVGSIHSVKGRTHTATLVLETFYFDFQLRALKPWLLGEKSGGSDAKVRQERRMRQHYVAMTRPTHLLCLAMKEEHVEPSEVGVLKDRGWRLARVGPQGAVQWL